MNMYTPLYPVVVPGACRKYVLLSVTHPQDVVGARCVYSPGAVRDQCFVVVVVELLLLG